MKKRFIVLVLLGAMMTAPANAQWNSWNTSSTISGVFGAINHGIESAERKKQMEIYAKEKAQWRLILHVRHGLARSCASY